MRKARIHPELTGDNDDNDLDRTVSIEIEDVHAVRRTRVCRARFPQPAGIYKDMYGSSRSREETRSKGMSRGCEEQALPSVSELLESIGVADPLYADAGRRMDSDTEHKFSVLGARRKDNSNREGVVWVIPTGVGKRRRHGALKVLRRSSHFHGYMQWTAEKRAALKRVISVEFARSYPDSW